MNPGSANSMLLERVRYDDLNGRQKENFNIAKLAGVLADYGYAVIRLSDDWNGADLIAIHVKDGSDLRIQVKGRFTLDKKYTDKGLYIAFRGKDGCWYLYPHDKLLGEIQSRIATTEVWAARGTYNWPDIPEWLIPYLELHRIAGGD